jgi:hypothetical protein
MDIARLFGIIIVFGVLGIWGGGLMYHWTHGYGLVWVYVAILAVVALAVALKATIGKAPSH